MQTYVFDLLRKRVSKEGFRFFQEGLSRLTADELPILFSRLSRKVGSHPVHLTKEEWSILPEQFGKNVPFFWQTDELARALVFLIFSEQSTKTDPFRRELAEDLFYKGDNNEKRALLRTLPLTEKPELYHPIATEACRTGVVSVFSGIGCENPYPSRYFTEKEFNHMVIKAMTLGLDLERIYDWRSRNNRELYRMSLDHIQERESAGRSYPEGNRSIVDDYRRNHEVL